MPLVVMEWKLVPGENLPSPRLQDDSALFPAGIVIQVREWMRKEMIKFQVLRSPTDQRIGFSKSGPFDPASLPAAEFIYVKGYGPEGPLTQSFHLGTAEILMKKKGAGHPILAAFHYLTARTDNNLVILGPQLWIDQKGRIL